jgi:CubicO group peptidase (beta-lactamase class C family)
VVSAWVQNETVAGAVLLVARSGQILHEKAYGWADLAGPTVMSTSTVFDLASVTKVMATTMAMMVLVDEGRVALDAPLSRYLPDFTGGGKEAITIEQLLTHRAGLYQWQPTYYHADDAEEAYAYIRGLPLAWPVGAERHYSDLGFMLLGRLVEAVSGVPLHAFVRDRVYAPLGLTSTAYRPTRGPYAATSHGNPFERRMVYDPDFGYRIEGDPTSWDGWRTHTLRGEVNDGNAHHVFRGVAGHAGLFSTGGELRVLVDLLLAGGVHNGQRIIATELVARFLATTGDGQALGWQVPDYAPAGSFAHTGFTGTFVLGVPRDDLTVILLTNRQNGGVDETGRYPDIGALQRAVTEALTGGL